MAPPPQFSCQACNAPFCHGRMYCGRVSRHILSHLRRLKFQFSGRESLSPVCCSLCSLNWKKKRKKKGGEGLEESRFFLWMFQYLKLLGKFGGEKLLLFCCSVSMWREICSSLVIRFRHRPQWFSLRVRFSPTLEWENLMFGSDRRHRLPQKEMWKWRCSQLLALPPVASKETRFCFLFSMPTVTAMFYPQVWPWLCSRSVRFTRNKHFFLAHWLFFFFWTPVLQPSTPHTSLWVCFF